jgi:oxygen-independent coproporphyrinogen-3 oxidase
MATTTSASVALPVVPPPAGADAEQTTAGNYFVANYPPFSFWTPDRVGEALAALERAPTGGADLGLYVHIPFCRKRCHFCYFKVYTGKNASEVHDYLDAVITELGLYADRPAVAGRPLRFIYFGGGTPSFLSVKQLARLFDGIKAVLPWASAEEIAFECEPGTLNDKKLRFLRDAGVTRLSLGVENFDDELLSLNNRAHHSKEVFRAYEYARSCGFPQINIDLIAGMLGETESNWHRCVEQTVALAPESVTIYQMEVPYNTGIARQMKAEGRAVAPVADWATKRRWVAEAFAALEAAGYTVGSAYTAVRDAPATRFLYRDALWTGADMLGVGVASFSHVAGVHFQNQREMGAYQDELRARRLPIYRALTMTADERLIREFVLQMKLGHVSAADFRVRHGVDVHRRFEPQLAALRDAGDLNIDGDELRLTRDALLRVDRLLHPFFLPEHQHARYA